MGSGKVNIRNTSEYTMPTLFEGRPDLNNIAEITGIVISKEGETVFSSSFSSINADVVEQTGAIDTVGVTTISQESADASGSLSYDINKVPDAPSVPTI